MDKSMKYLTNLPISDRSTTSSGIIEAKVHRRLQKEFADYLKPHGLTAMEWFVIGFLYEHHREAVTLSTLSRDLQTTLPYLTNLINQLQAKGLVERVENSGDNRVKRVSLLPSASGMYKKVERDLRNKLREFVSKRVSTKDFAVYLRVMYQLAEA
jgi:DNA-binding MarR family transcriptional regulator